MKTTGYNISMYVGEIVKGSVKLQVSNRHSCLVSSGIDFQRHPCLRFKLGFNACY